MAFQPSVTGIGDQPDKGFFPKPSGTTPTTYTPSLDFSDSRNSQLISLLYGGLS